MALHTGFELCFDSIDVCPSDAVVVAVDQNGLSPLAKTLDKALGGVIKAAVQAGDCKTDLGSVWTWTDFDSDPALRIVVVGLGQAKDVSPQQFEQALISALTQVNGEHIDTVTSYAHDHRGLPFSTYHAARYSFSAATHAFYTFRQTFGDTTEQAIDAFSLGSAKKDRTAVTKALKHAQGIAQGVALARDLCNLPSNICTPTYLAQAATDIASNDRRLHINVLEEKEMKKLGMNALLSVAQGSHEPAKLIVLKYNGAAKTEAPVAIVGKGITFDTGGISLKPREKMEDMKYDMGGAASVLGTFAALKALQPKINVVGLVPTCDNMPGGKASCPNHIVKSLSGKTIEILNTDAEGRLILSDALAYALRYKPKHMIDIATLTGACIIALGHHHSALMSNDDQLADALLGAGLRSGDRAWRLPLGPEYHAQLESPVADLANIGGKPAGSITAGCFLENFVGDCTWAHLDVAGTASGDGTASATGRPVPLLVQHLLEQTDRTLSRA